MKIARILLLFLVVVQLWYSNSAYADQISFHYSVKN